MSSCLKAGFSVYGSTDATDKRVQGSFKLCSSMEALQFKESNSKDHLLAKTLDVSDQKGVTSRATKLDPVNAQASSVCVPKSLKWWEKSHQPNMLEIESAQELVDSLSNAGDRLAIIDFYSPGCGGCRSLHPKMCQLAESNPNTIFFQVNYEQHKAMCNALHVYVLPFFRMYRGEKGKICSFSCTNATIKKFKDALAKYGTDQFGVGSAKGLDESEVSALASIGLVPKRLVPNQIDGNGVNKLIGEENVLLDALSQ